MILTWFINRVKCWFDDLVQTAIRDGLRLYGLDTPEDDDLRKLRLLIAFQIWSAILLVIAVKVVS